jgi:hypothetical protein
MIIGLTGYAQSGKDTVANILVENYGFTRVAFADKIRELLYEMNPKIIVGYDNHTTVQLMVDHDGWDVAKQNPDVRAMLQNIGVGARKVFGEEFWIAKALQGRDWSIPTVITDVRFENEARLLKKWSPEDTQLWRIKRLGIGAVNSHVSEKEMDGYPVDQIFVNNGTIADLEVLIKIRMNGLK